MPVPVRPAVTGFSVERYRAFEEAANVDLGRLTLLLGRNNAGKSALCFAPLYFAQAFRADAAAPLVFASEKLGFGSPQSAIFRRQASGTRVQLRLEDAGSVTSVTLGVTVIPERHYAQQITVFETEEPRGDPQGHKLVDWSTVQTAIRERPGLVGLVAEVGGSAASGRCRPERWTTSAIRPPRWGSMEKKPR